MAELCAQVYAIKEVCSHQNQAMVALVKLKSYGIAEDDILNLNNYLERNMMNNKIFSGRPWGSTWDIKRMALIELDNKNVEEETPSS